MTLSFHAHLLRHFDVLLIVVFVANFVFFALSRVFSVVIVVCVVLHVVKS